MIWPAKPASPVPSPAQDAEAGAAFARQHAGNPMDWAAAVFAKARVDAVVAGFAERAGAARSREALAAALRAEAERVRGLVPALEGQHLGPALSVLAGVALAEADDALVSGSLATLVRATENLRVFPNAG